MSEELVPLEGLAAKRTRLEKELEEIKKQMPGYSPGMGEINPPTGLPAHIRSLILTFDTTNGNMQIAGPIAEKLLCYGMLHLAMDIVKDWNDKQAKIPGVVTP